MVAPTGVPAAMDIIIPTKAHDTESIAEKIVTLLKLLNILIAERAGNTTSADIRSDPTNCMATTITTDMTTAIRRLYAPALVPVALEKPSSKVTANILL